MNALAEGSDDYNYYVVVELRMKHQLWIANKTGIWLVIILVNSIIAAADDIVLDEVNLSRFIGRIDHDPKALNGQSVWLDPLIAGSPRVELPAGRHHFYLYARCMTPVAETVPICNMRIVQADTGDILYQRDVMRIEFGDGSLYKTIDWHFDFPVPAAVKFQVEMRVMGKNEFFLDSIGYATADAMVRWDNSTLDHHLGVKVDDAKALSGKTHANSITLAFGPFITLPEKGRYEAVFRIAIAPDFQAENIGTLDVYSHYGVYDGHTDHKTYAMRGLSTVDFPNPGEFMEFTLPFDYDGAKNMEFRFFVYHVIRNAIRLDRITIRPVN